MEGVLRKLRHVLSAILLVAATGVLGGGPTAQAAPYFQLTNAPGGSGPATYFVSADHWRTVRVYNAGLVETLAAGMFGLRLLETLADGTPIGEPAFDLPTFCLEIGQQIALPALYEAKPVDTVLPSAKADQIARLWGQRLAAVSDPTDPRFEGVSGASSRDRVAAFQVAIWELAVDGNDGLGAGQFRLVSQDVPLRALSLAYLAIAADPLLPFGPVRALVSPFSQDQLDDPISDIPEPASAFLLAAALLGLGIGRGRRTT
jgi:hypothetical protein